MPWSLRTLASHPSLLQPWLAGSTTVPGPRRSLSGQLTKRILFPGPQLTHGVGLQALSRTLGQVLGDPEATAAHPLGWGGGDTSNTRLELGLELH